jgi:hypothetical protein
VRRRGEIARAAASLWTDPGQPRACSAQRISTAADAATPRSREDGDMATTTHVVELADRHSDDLDVVLLWARRSGRLWVNVTHRRSGRIARIDATAANALDVFNHPLAYAGADR